MVYFICFLALVGVLCSVYDLAVMLKDDNPELNHYFDED